MHVLQIKIFCCHKHQYSIQ